MQRAWACPSGAPGVAVQSGHCPCGSALAGRRLLQDGGGFFRHAAGPGLAMRALEELALESALVAFTHDDLPLMCPSWQQDRRACCLAALQVTVRLRGIAQGVGLVDADADGLLLHQREQLLRSLHQVFALRGVGEQRRSGEEQRPLGRQQCRIELGDRSRSVAASCLVWCGERSCNGGRELDPSGFAAT